MKCPFCKSDDTRVIDVRTNQKGIRTRQRECKNPDCYERVTTYELSQAQIAEELYKHLPMEIVNRIGMALAIAFPENGEHPKDIFDFYFENVSDF